MELCLVFLLSNHGQSPHLADSLKQMGFPLACVLADLEIAEVQGGLLSVGFDR